MLRVMSGGTGDSICVGTVEGDGGGVGGGSAGDGAAAAAPTVGVVRSCAVGRCCGVGHALAGISAQLDGGVAVARKAQRPVGCGNGHLVAVGRADGIGGICPHIVSFTRGEVFDGSHEAARAIAVQSR